MTNTEFTDRFGRKVIHLDAGFGWVVLHVLGRDAAFDPSVPDSSQRAMTIDWNPATTGPGPAADRAVAIAESYPPSWWVEPAQDDGGTP